MIHGGVGRGQPQVSTTPSHGILSAFRSFRVSCARPQGRALRCVRVVEWTTVPTFPLIPRVACRTPKLYGKQPVTLIWSLFQSINDTWSTLGKIRPAVWTELGGDEAMLRISLDSYSGEVLSNEKGSGDSIKIPDFVTVKANASLHHQRLNGMMRPFSQLKSN